MIETVTIVKNMSTITAGTLETTTDKHGNPQFIARYNFGDDAETTFWSKGAAKMSLEIRALIRRKREVAAA